MIEPIEDTAFVCFNFSKGFGGHYLSMAETVRSGIFLGPLVIDLGFSPTSLLDEVRTGFIPHGWTRHAEARQQLRASLLKVGTKVVFCYDIAAYNITRRALAKDPIQVVYVKCGGPTLTLYYPKPDYLIVYSEEDEIFFGDKLPNSVMAKIPNRVSERLLKESQKSLSEEALHAIGKRAGDRNNVEKIVCIARVGHSYERKIRRAFDYLRAVNGAGRSATLTVIGSIEHGEVMKVLSEDSPKGTMFLSDAFHTQDSARFLSNFTTAITTGRGTVEACLMGLKVLVPFDGGERLAVLSPGNYDGLIRSNFSGRARPDELTEGMKSELAPDDAEQVRDWIRNDFAMEYAARGFRDFLDRLKPTKAPSAPEMILGGAYFFYVAVQHRSQAFRWLASRVKAGISRILGVPQ